MPLEALNAMTTTSLVNTHKGLFEAGVRVGLDADTLLPVVLKVGPDHALAALQFLELLSVKDGLATSKDPAKDTKDYLSIAKLLLAKLLATYKDEILSQAHTYESVLFDLLVNWLNQG